MRVKKDERGRGGDVHDRRFKGSRREVTNWALGETEQLVMC